MWYLYSCADGYMYVRIHVFSQKIPTLYNQADSSGEKKPKDVSFIYFE